VYLNSWMTDIPLYVHAPGVAPTTIDEAVDLRDVAATVLDFAGLLPPPGSTGRSLLSGDWSPHERRLVSEAFPLRGEALFAAVDGDLDSIKALARRLRETQTRRPSYDPKIAVTTSQYRLIHNHATGSYELYDRNADPSELRDVAGEHQDVVDQLQQFLREWHREQAREIYCRFVSAMRAGP
jgi:arylsulfatase A-like enzyme